MEQEHLFDLADELKALRDRKEALEAELKALRALEKRMGGGGE